MPALINEEIAVNETNTSGLKQEKILLSYAISSYFHNLDAKGCMWIKLGQIHGDQLLWTIIDKKPTITVLWD